MNFFLFRAFYSRLLFRNLLIKKIFKFSKKSRSFGKCCQSWLFKANFHTRQCAIKWKNCCHETTISYNSRCNLLIEKWNSLFKKHFKNQAWECHAKSFMLREEKYFFENRLKKCRNNKNLNLINNKNLIITNNKNLVYDKFVYFRRFWT